MLETYEFFEIAMLVLFGISWPISAFRSYKSRTAKGKSIMFITLILLGYIAGIVSKFINAAYMANFSTKWYVLLIYITNFVFVSIDFLLYFRNKKLDKISEAKEN